MIADHLFFALVNVLLAWSVYVVLTTGALSFAAGAFMAVGAYGSGWLTVRAGMPLYQALALASLGAALIGVLVGLPSLRLKGIYFILATVGLTISTQVILENVGALGGSTGFAGMVGAGLWDAVAAVAVLGLALLLVSRSGLQRMLDAVREDEQAAGAMGVNVVLVRTGSFAVGAAIAAYAGGLYAHQLVFVRPENFNIQVSIFAVFYVVLGGGNSFVGPALGAFVLTLLPEYVTVFKEWRPTVVGLALIVILLIRPEGILPMRFRTVRAGAAA